MDERKIMSLGKSSLVISIPKSWLRTNDLTKGDRVYLETRPDGSLVVHPSLEDRRPHREIHLPIYPVEPTESIKRRIIGAYLDGYTLIKLTSGKVFSAVQQRAIRSIVATLYLMIIESESGKIVLRTLIDEAQSSVATSINRMHAITQAMCRDILTSFTKWDAELIRSVISLEDDVDQLMYFLMRLIRYAAINPSLGKKLGIDQLDCLDYQTLVHRIERTADHNTDIAFSMISIIESGNEVPESLLNILKTAAEIAYKSYTDAVEAFLTKDVQNTNKIIDNENRIADIFREVTPLPSFGDDFSGANLADVVSMRESLKKMGHCATEIAELTIDRAYKYLE